MSGCEPDSNNSFTMEYQKHKLSGYCLSLKQIDGIEEKINFDSFVRTKQSEDEDISKVFIESLDSITSQIYFNCYLHPERTRLTKRDKEDFIFVEKPGENEKKSERSLSFHWKIYMSCSQSM